MTKLQFPDPLTQTLIGFENLINRATTTYPPYNLFKDGEDYVLEIAVSGWTKSELDVEVTGTTLKVTGTKAEADNREYLHRGLAHRSWTRTWTLEPDIHVSHVELEDGILWVELTQETKSSSRKIAIS
jgi:molecular chaperone IbpA